MSDITPNRIPEKAILSFAQMGNPMFEFKIEQHHNDFYLMLVVDCEKMDKNSGKFDSEYKDALVDDSLTGIQAFVNRPIGKIERIAEEIKKFFSVEVRVSFNFKNYKYLDQIERKIQGAIKQTSRPEINAVISAEGDNPVVRLGLYNFKKIFKNSSEGKTDNKEFIKELQKALGSEIDLESYRWFTTSVQK
jgi:hypothetical protein